MEFLRFICSCILATVGYLVGDVYHSDYNATVGLVGAIGSLIFVAAILICLKIFGLDPECLVQRKGAVLYAVVISITTTMLYYFVAFLLID